MSEKYFIVTYGCQMNVHESEKIAGILRRMGYEETPNMETADIIVFNTCCIRENAENHAFGNIGALKKNEKTKPRPYYCRRGVYDPRTGKNGSTQKEISVYRYHVRRVEFRGLGVLDIA